MTRLVTFLLTVLVVAAGLHWLADRPGTIVVEWQDHIAETTVFRAFIMLALAIGLIFAGWSLLRHVWSSPAYVGRLLHRRRQKRGLDALSGGIIAIGAGDRTSASRYASQARKALPNEPLTHLLRAQTAQLTGDRTTARRIFEAMLASRDTEQLGLRGLFLEAQREGESEAARQFAERAVALNPKLEWPAEALFDLQCRAGDWPAALETLAVGRRNGLIDKSVAGRRRAILLTAQAQAAEDGEPNKALELALEANRLARDLVPAAAIAGRILASRGQTARAARIVLKTWRLAPHPELAAAYAHVRPGDSPRDRLVRVRHLGRITPDNVEAPLAVAVSAIEAREWDEARKVLEPLLEARLTQRVCTLMARIEAEQHGHTGRVREWLARAVNAPRDPAWTADGVVADHWSPVSPVTGALDAFRWRVPVELVDAPSGARLSAKVEALVGLGAPVEPAIEHAEMSKPTAEILQAETIELPDRTAEAPAPQPKIEKPVAKPPPARADPTLEHERPVPRAEPRTEPVPPAPRVTEPAEPVPHKTAVTDRTRPESKPPRSRKPLEPKIFVAPHAPDDPGPDAAEGDGLGSPFGPSPAKI
jgi:HemY protein